MYYIQIDSKISLADIANKVKNIQFTLLLDKVSRILMRYNGVPFTTNIPVDETFSYTSNINNCINGDYTNIQLFIDDSKFDVVDKLMQELFDNNIMSITAKLDA